MNGEQKSHRVADGDTLARLAERYLGDPNRKLELYEYNRDVLSNPDVLPIGADLRIPPQIPIQIAAPQSELQTSQQEPSESQAPLAPLDPVLIKPQTARPETAQPASATPVSSTNLKHAKPRTYQVQIGDTLVDISRKLYGDGRRHEQLFEANRNVLKNPAALKPGMVLVVP